MINVLISYNNIDIMINSRINKKCIYINNIILTFFYKILFFYQFNCM